MAHQQQVTLVARDRAGRGLAGLEGVPPRHRLDLSPRGDGPSEDLSRLRRSRFAAVEDTVHGGAFLPEDAGDLLHLGASLVAQRAPGVGLRAVRVLDDGLSSRTGLLIPGIDWARDKGVDVISMSLGTYREGGWSELEQAVLRADEVGIVLVASSPDLFDQPAPARFSGVISAAPDFRLESFCFTDGARESADFIAYPYPREAPGIERQRNFQGPSFASAHLAGIACLIREQQRDLSCWAVRTILHDLSGKFHPFDRRSVSEEQI